MGFCHFLPNISRHLIALLLIAVLIFSSTLLIQVASAANPPEPTYGSANMNGDPSEWDMNVGGDFFTYLYRAGDIEKQIEANASLRYDCGTQTLYVLVMTVPGVPALVSPTGAWGAIGSVSNKVFTGNSGNGSVLPAFVWVGQGYDGNSSHALGYEAAFTLAPGSYTLILHIQVEHDGSQTAATPNFPLSGVPLEIICTPNPSISVVKMISTDNTTWNDANTPPGITIPAGTDLYYQFNITNTGNVTLSDITLTDSLYSISPPLPPTLAVGESYLYYYGPVTAQIGIHTDTATATGTVDSTEYSDTDDANYQGTALPNPAITVIKFVSSDNATWNDANTPPGLLLPVGGNVYYRFVVINIGNVEIDNITLTDNTYSLPPPPATTLAPNASFTVYYGPITALSGQHTNTATVNGQYENTNYTQTDDANYFGCGPAISLTKLVSADNATWYDANSPPGIIVLAGANVYYQYIINNTGNVELTHLSLTDNTYSLSPMLPASLAVGESFSYYYGPVAALMGQHTNTAAASGRCISGIYHNATDVANYLGVTASIQVTKQISTDNATWTDADTPPGLLVPVGTNVYFKFTINNTGTSELANINLTDNTYTLVGLTLPLTLAPDEEFTYYLGPITALAGQHTNTATATGTFDNTTYTDTDDANYFGADSQISVIKQISADNSTWIDADTPPGLEVTIGSDVYYKFVVTNTGNVELFNITLTDSLYSIMPAPPLFLAPNETYTYYYGPVTALAGQHTNIANATGQYYETVYNATDNANYYGTPEPLPAINVIKQISSDNATWVDADMPPGLEVAVGNNVYFKYVINNTGNTDLSNLTLTDNVYSLGASPPTTLTPNETYTYFFGPITAESGQHTNIANATGQYNNESYNSTDNANYFGTSPQITVIKQISNDNSTWIDADTPPGLEVTIGSNVYYKFVITNTGNVDLFDITLTDNLYSITPTPPMSLAPNETYTYYYGPITALSGQHTNTANATGTVDDTTYSDTDNANYFGSVEPKPAITVVKQISTNKCTWVDADTPPGITVKQHQRIYYKINITNTGDTELYNLTLTDTLYDLSGVSLPSSLAPNASFVTYIGPIWAIAGQQTNIATATGDYNNTTYEDSDPANYYATTKPCPSICIVKSVSSDNTTWVDANSPPGLIVDAGSDVYFKFEITNTGNVELSNIKLVDSAFYLNNGLPSSLEPSETYTCYYGPVQAEACQHTDHAVVSGKYHYKTYYDGDKAYYYGTQQQAEYCTYTASDYSGCGKPAQILKYNFKNCFNNGLEIGEYRFWGFWGGNGYKWTSVTSLQQFLECNGYNSAIYRSRYNPTNLRWGGGTLAVQTATLSINVAFSEKAIDDIPTGFGDLHFVLLGNSLSGKTVSEILEVANDALAGKGLPYGYSYNSLNELITQLNCAFENGVPSSWANTHLQT